MSKNFNRARFNKAQSGNEIKKYKLNYLYPNYWDEGIHLKKGHFSSKYREFKTWKHNRKTQYK